MGRKRSKRSKKGSKRQTKRPGLQLTAHPFSGADREALRAAFAERGKNAVGSLPVLMEKVRGLFRRHEPITILATVAYYGSMQGVGQEGPTGRTMLSSINQHHMELLQAIALSIPHSEWGGFPPTGQVIQEAIEDIGELADAFAASRMSNMTADLEADKRVLLSLQERLRLHTQVVRNWGYAHQVRTLSSELYGVVDSELEAALGFTSTELIQCAQAIVRLYERRGSERFKRLSNVFRMKNAHDLVHAYYREYPNLAGTAEEFLAEIPKMPFLNLKSLMLSHADLSLPELATYSPTDVAAEAGISESRAKVVMEQLARTPGELSDADPMHFFMDNPIWTKPGIQIGTSFVFPIPQATLSHIHRVLRSLIEIAGIKATYEERRASYLEAKVGELLRRAFPTARLEPSSKWSIGTDTYETDWLVILDRTVLIVEAKSAALTAEALRGAPARAKKHIGELVVAPALQSARLAGVIRRAADGDSECVKVTGVIGVDPSEVDTVIRLSITLDDFSMIAAAEDDLKAVGWAPDDLELPATMNIADFESVIDILERPGVILHYFADRPRLQRASHLIADELDLLGVYLESLFHIPEVAGGKLSLVATGESKVIDDYYARIEAGLSANKPEAAVAPQVLAVLDTLAHRQPPGWTTMSLDLLQIGNVHQQKKLWKGLEKLRREVPKTYADPKHECALIVLPSDADIAVALYVYPQALADKRHATMEQLANETLDKTGRKRMTIIGKKIELWDQPYTMAAIAIASPQSKSGD